MAENVFHRGHSSVSVFYEIVKKKNITSFAKLSFVSIFQFELASSEIVSLENV